MTDAQEVFFNNAFDLMATVGADGYFKKVNPAFERILGYTSAEMLAKPVVEFLHPEDVNKTKSGIQRLTAGEPTIQSVNRYLCKDGTYKWISWNTKPISDVFYTVGRDISDHITELKRTEAQVLQLQKMDAVGRLAGGIAHDFNNMLGAISLYCDMLVEAADNPEAVRECAQDIVGATSRASALTRQLLVFSRKQIIQPQALALNPLIENLQKMLVRLIGSSISMSSKLADDLHTIVADPSQLEQVILNLAVNARDAMPSGGTLTIETSNVYLDEAFTSRHLSVTQGQYVLLAITDTGTGMDAETQSKIFEPFFTTKGVGKGTGLGLSTTYGIVKQAKGTIWVYSEPDRGTVFKVYLPAAEGAVAEPMAAQSAPLSSEGHVTILLVEDDDHLRQGFAQMLANRGFHVLTAANGQEALDLTKSHPGPVHLMLSDVVMPGQSGFELHHEIAKLFPELRALFMSGYTDESISGLTGEELKNVPFIQKPFGTNALVAKVQEVLARRPWVNRKNN